MTPDEITALAAACERAAEILSERGLGCRCDQCVRDAALVEIVEAHARALRDGRVTVREEASDG